MNWLIYIQIFTGLNAPKKTVPLRLKPLSDKMHPPVSGEMSEWLKEHAWKACKRVKAFHGFESHSLRFLNKGCICL
jgi:hypothetical protein